MIYLFSDMIENLYHDSPATGDFNLFDFDSALGVDPAGLLNDTDPNLLNDTSDLMQVDQIKTEPGLSSLKPCTGSEVLKSVRPIFGTSALSNEVKSVEEDIDISLVDTSIMVPQETPVNTTKDQTVHVVTSTQQQILQQLQQLGVQQQAQVGTV